MNKLKTLTAVLAMIGAVGAQPALAACQDNIVATTPDSDFTVHDNGTVTHNTTGLMWMRCSLGQEWSGSTCSGSASTYTWQNALQTADGFSYAGYSDWRLPNKNELESIVEERCVSPAINTTVFPTTPSNRFWSSSPDAYASYDAWHVGFHYGGVFNSYKNSSSRVRLVRAGP